MPAPQRELRTPPLRLALALPPRLALALPLRLALLLPLRLALLLPLRLALLLALLLPAGCAPRSPAGARPLAPFATGPHGRPDAPLRPARPNAPAAHGLAPPRDGDGVATAFVRAGDLPPLPAGAVAELGARIDAILADRLLVGAVHSVLVVGADTGQVIYERGPDAPLVPASNVKLLTTAAALGTFGEDYRTTAVVRGQLAPNASGVVAGDLVLFVPYELGWNAKLADDPSFALGQLAAQVHAAGVRSVTGAVVVRGELVYGGNPTGTYDPEANRSAAAAAFREKLEEAGVVVHAIGTNADASVPAAGTILASWRSLPLAVLCSPINGSSHNELADALLRELGWSARHESSFAAGLPLLTGVLTSCGIDTHGAALHDGSGLSHANRLSARQLVGLLECMASRPAGPRWERTLSVAGVRGTLRGRLSGPDTVGRVLAKTGTLNGVVALSGLLEHRHDGQRYTFSLLVNGVTDLAAARAAHDAIVEALAQDWRRLGARSPAPVLDSVTNDGNGRTVTVCWRPPPTSAPTTVWRSADGRHWPRGEAHVVTGRCHRTEPVSGSERVYVRLTSASAAGESDPSDVYASRVSPARSPLLLVDGNDRWQAEPQPENTMARGHDFLVDHALAIAGRAYDSCSTAALTAGAVDAARYRAILWSAGEESTANDSFDGQEQALLSRFAAAGGALFVSGAEIGWDLGSEGSEADQRFYAEVLGARFVGDDAATTFVSGKGGIFLDLLPLSFLSPGGLVASTPDRIEPAEAAATVLEYVGGLGGGAAIQTTGPRRVVTLGFPFECVDTVADRRRMMEAALGYLVP